MTTRKKAAPKAAAVPAVQLTAAEDSTIIHSCVFDNTTTITGDVTGAFSALADALKMNAAALKTLADGYVDTVRKQQPPPTLVIGGGAPADTDRKIKSIYDTPFPAFTQGA